MTTDADTGSGLAFLAEADSLVGQVRAANEDSYLVTDTLVAVADGMGGHAAGEVASALAVEVIDTVSSAHAVEAITGAVLEANDQIFLRSLVGSSERGMGTTLCVAAVVADGDTEAIAILNVGDSRVYLLAAGELHQLTEDHSLVESMVRAGRLTEEEAAVHPQRNVLTRALGVDGEATVDAWLLQPATGDRLMLCSDGLYNELGFEEIQSILVESATPEAAALRLSSRADAAGGRDNITVVVADLARATVPSAELGSRLRWLGTSSSDVMDRDTINDTASIPIVAPQASPTQSEDAAPEAEGTEAEDRNSATSDSDSDAPAGASVDKSSATASGLTLDSDGGADLRSSNVEDAGDDSDTPTLQGSSKDQPSAQDGESDVQDPPRKRRPRWRTGLFVLAILAVVGTGIGAIVASTSSNWVVKADGQKIVLYRSGVSSVFGTPDSKPATDLKLNELTDNDQRKLRDGKSFPTKAEAQAFVQNLQVRSSTSATTTIPQDTSTTTTVTVPPVQNDPLTGSTSTPPQVVDDPGTAITPVVPGGPVTTEPIVGP